MTYAQKDRSIDSGAPIECYEFIASHKTWRFTSYSKPITVAGHEYTPLPITRTAVETGSIIDALTTMDFNVPADNEMSQTFCYTISPRKLDVTVYRVHEGDDYSTDYKIEYKGEISGAEADGKWAVFQTSSKLTTRLNGNLSAVYYQRSCNHDLFDVRCKVVRSSFLHSATVVKIQGQIITVDNDGFANTELVAGTMTNTRTGEVQAIISNDNNVIRLGYPFFDLIVGDTVELVQGCDHQRLGHCKNRYNNVANYGGFDFVPATNPFAALNYDTTKSTTQKIREDQELRINLPQGKVV